MSTPALCVVCLLYLYAGGEQIWRGNLAMGFVFFSYTVSNIAFIFATK
jgi:hypothetical protein